jgi:signal transduction histidine kinase
VQDARTVARAVRGLVLQGDTATLKPVLHALAGGGLELDASGWSFASGGRQPPWVDQPLHDVTAITVLGLDGRVLAGSDPAGAAFTPVEQAAWPALLAAVRDGRRDSAALLVRVDQDGAALGAYPVLDDQDRPVAAVVVAGAAPSSSGPPVIVRTLAIFGWATVAVLAGASIFAVASSAAVAWMLSRRLVRRLETLGGAAEAFASGDLARRVSEGADDEVGGLARRFNRMADDLQRSMCELEAERDRVTGLLENRRQLVAGVSHELRTPVATARGYLEAALERDGALPADVRADLETVDAEVVRLQRLIEDLFSLSRADVGRLDLRLGPVDAGAIARRLAETAAPLAWTRQRVEVVTEIAANLPPARADARRLEQVVSNLLSNAVRHTPPGGLVAVVVTGGPDAIDIEVRDTGGGITARDLPHIFERFYRGSDENGSAGAGLGLALAKELTEAMGGAITAASTPGEGSRFTVRLARESGVGSRESAGED